VHLQDKTLVPTRHRPWVQSKGKRCRRSWVYRRVTCPERSRRRTFWVQNQN